MKYCISHIQKATPAAIASGVLFPLISHTVTHFQFIIKPWKVYNLMYDGGFCAEGRNRSLSGPWAADTDNGIYDGYNIQG